MDKFDEIEVGQVAKITHTITLEDIEKFSELTGDDNRLHMDEAFASKTEFKKPIAHGMLGASFISTIIGTKLPGDGALWFSQSLEFILPVMIGDFLTIKAEVIKKIAHSRVIEIKTTIINQDKQLVTKGLGKVKVVKQDKGNSDKVKGLKRKKIALIVGATGGIGSAVCMKLALSGFDIMLHYHKNKAHAIELRKKITELGRSAYICSGDISQEVIANDIVNSTIKRLGSISVVVNCATPRIQTIKFADLEWDDFGEHINNQVKAVFHIVQAVCPHMEKAKYGKIINITTQALESPVSGWLPYITAKGALFGLSKALAYELAPKGIMLNLVSPGMTDTSLISNIPERVKMVTAAKTPIGRLASPDDVANAVEFLSSHKSDFMCGETIRVNGGQVMW